MFWFWCILPVPDSKVHGANMGPIWGRQDPGGPHVGPMNFAIWDFMQGHFTAIIRCECPFDNELTLIKMGTVHLKNRL